MKELLPRQLDAENHTGCIGKQNNLAPNDARATLGLSARIDVKLRERTHGEAKAFFFLRKRQETQDRSLTEDPGVQRKYR